jgi:hypothetical protein
MMNSPGRRTLHYHSFILTIWREAVGRADSEPSTEAAIWRCSLENPHTGERVGFRSADELGRFLSQWAVLPPPDGAVGEAGDRKFHDHAANYLTSLDKEANS